MYNIVDTLSTTAPYSLMGQVGILSIYYVDTTYSNMYNINGTILTDTQKSPLYKKKKEHASVLFEKRKAHGNGNCDRAIRIGTI